MNEPDIADVFFHRVGTATWCECRACGLEWRALQRELCPRCMWTYAETELALATSDPPTASADVTIDGPYENQRVEKSAIAFNRWVEDEDADIGEISIALYDLVADYRALLADWISASSWAALWKEMAHRKRRQLRQSQQAEFKMHSKLLRMEARVSLGSSEPKP